MYKLFNLQINIITPMALTMYKLTGSSKLFMFTHLPYTMMLFKTVIRLFLIKKKFELYGVIFKYYSRVIKL